MEGGVQSKFTAQLVYFVKGILNKKTGTFFSYGRISRLYCCPKDDLRTTNVTIVYDGKPFALLNVDNGRLVSGVVDELTQRWMAYMDAAPCACQGHLQKLEDKLLEMERKIDALAFAPGMPEVVAASSRFQANDYELRRTVL